MCGNTYHSVKNFETDRMVENHIKNSVSQEQNMTFSLNKKILKLYFKDYIFRNYHVLQEITLKVLNFVNFTALSR